MMNLHILYTLIFVLLVHITNGQISHRVVNEKFAKQPFDLDLSPQNIHKFIFGKIIREKKIQANKYSDKADTLLTFRAGRREFVFLKTAERIFFYKAVIADQQPTLANGVRIGMSKEEFIKLFHMNQELNTADWIIISDSDDFCYHTFFFNKNKLAKIVLKNRVD